MTHLLETTNHLEMARPAGRSFLPPVMRPILLAYETPVTGGVVVNAVHSWLNVALLFLLGGCASTEPLKIVDSSQNGSAVIALDETVSLILSRYSQCDDSASAHECVDSTSESNELHFEHCINQSLRKNQAKLNILPTKEFRRIAFPDKEFARSPRSPEAIIELLRNDEFKKRIDFAHIRYLVILDVETSSGGNEKRFRPHTGMKLSNPPKLAEFPEFYFRYLLGSAGKTWEKTSTFKVTIIDMQQGLRSGSVMAKSAGESGYTIRLWMGVVPLALIPRVANTELHACSALGQELGQKYFLRAGAVKAPE